MCFHRGIIFIFQTWWGFPADHKVPWLSGCLGCLLPGSTRGVQGWGRHQGCPGQLFREQDTLVSPLGQLLTILVDSWPTLVPEEV